MGLSARTAKYCSGRVLMRRSPREIAKLDRVNPVVGCERIRMKLDKMNLCCAPES
jgi:hypothetical protein